MNPVPWLQMTNMISYQGLVRTFPNFYEDLMNNQKIPDSGVLTQKVKEQIADQLKQAGQ